MAIHLQLLELFVKERSDRPAHNYQGLFDLTMIEGSWRQLNLQLVEVSTPAE